MTTAEFIAANAQGDIRRLALMANRWPEVDMTFALDQIAGRQKARTKLSSWAAVEGLTYPPRLSMEQCSSELTAHYKASIAKRLFPDGQPSVMADLTGGFGVDLSFVSREFKKAAYVERNPQLCSISSKNFQLLGLSNVTVTCAEAEDHLKAMERVSLLFLDPARRDEHGGRTIAIGDCTPDVAMLWPQLLSKADFVMVKLSPMLDIEKALSDLGGHIMEVHVVAVKGECKELLLVGNAQWDGNPVMHGVNIKSPDEMDDFSFRHGGNSSTPLLDGTVEDIVGKTLCEPDATVMKLGCFGTLASRHSLRAIAPNSHLFVANEPTADFPGRQFRILKVATLNRKELKSALEGIDRANVSVRNFPLSAEALRKKLKLKDGGNLYLFATTDQRNRHIIILTEKTTDGQESPSCSCDLSANGAEM